MSFSNSILVATKFKGATNITIIENARSLEGRLDLESAVNDFLYESAGIEAIYYERFRTADYFSIHGVLIKAKFKNSEVRTIGMGENTTLRQNLSQGDGAMDFNKASNLIGALTVEGTLGYSEEAMAARGRSADDVPAIAIVNIITLDTGKSYVDKITTNDLLFTEVRSSSINRVAKPDEKIMFSDSYAANAAVKPMLTGLSKRVESKDRFSRSSALWGLDGSQIDLSNPSVVKHSILTDNMFTEALSARVDRNFEVGLGIEEYLSK